MLRAVIRRVRRNGSVFVVLRQCSVVGRVKRGLSGDDPARLVGKPVEGVAVISHVPDQQISKRIQKDLYGTYAVSSPIWTAGTTDQKLGFPSFRRVMTDPEERTITVRFPASTATG
jgi:hypothetical protein